MTKQRFFGLRMELVRRINVRYSEGQLPLGKALAQCRDLKPIFSETCRSYKEAWEILKPARDLVGM